MANIYIYNSGLCEAVSFIETDSLYGFKSDGSVNASQIIENDSGDNIEGASGHTFVFREIKEI